MRIKVTACTVLILAGCTEYTVPLPEDADYFPRPVREVTRWQVRQDGENLEALVHMAEIRILGKEMDQAARHLRAARTLAIRSRAPESMLRRIQGLFSRL